jgi:hypothetical protein
VHVFLGPSCDYAAAPISRQVTFWDLPMVTPGAMAYDFGRDKKSRYKLMTRVGYNLNSLNTFMMVTVIFDCPDLTKKEICVFSNMSWLIQYTPTNPYLRMGKRLLN